MVGVYSTPNPMHTGSSFMPKESQFTSPYMKIHIMHALNMSDCESLFFIMCIVLRTGIGRGEMRCQSLQYIVTYHLAQQRLDY